MKIYLASPFFNDEENLYVKMAEDILRARGFEVYSPRENEIREGNIQKWAQFNFNADVNAIKNCDVMVMLYHGNYSDSGTAWECGYAYANGIPVVCVHVESKSNHISNLMVHCSAVANLDYIVDLADYDFNKMPKIIYTGDMT